MQLEQVKDVTNRLKQRKPNQGGNSDKIPNLEKYMIIHSQREAFIIPSRQKQKKKPSTTHYSQIAEVQITEIIL